MTVRLLSILTICLALVAGRQTAAAQGIPYFHNFTANEYRAHNQNFDIMADDDGTVYVANFEGLLYFDNAQWRTIHTPGITRITTLFRDSKGTIWTGGYNYMGFLETDGNGILQLHDIDSRKQVRGEVERIWEDGGKLYMAMSDLQVYVISDNILTPVQNVELQDDTDKTITGAYVNQTVDLEDGYKAIATNGEGVIIVDKNGIELCRITEDNNLCSSNVNRLSYNHHGLLWGATDNGIFAIAIPTAYTRYTPSEGLRGEVLSIAMLGQTVYAGTLSGLYSLKGNRFHPVKDITLASWQLARHDDTLIAATSDGIYAIDKEQNVRLITTANALSLLVDDSGFYSGEMDGVYRNGFDGNRKKVWDVEKVVKMVRDNEGVIWLQNIYGKIWNTTAAGAGLSVCSQVGDDQISTLVYYKGRVTPVSADETGQEATPGGIARLNAFPLFSYADDNGLLWLTDNKGRKPFALRDSTIETAMSLYVYPLMDYSIRTMTRRDGQLWMGGDKGINIVCTECSDPIFNVEPRLRIRSASLFGDSLLWGGYGDMPAKLPTLASNQNHIVFTYSIDFPSLLLNTQYRTRLNGGNWSTWETLTFEEYSNLTHGDYTFDVQARDAYGRITDIVSMSFTISPPFYLLWYMQVLYALLVVLAIYALVKFRLHQLEKDKRRLEAVVQERTADLVKAQHELVRQEKMATVGKLTQGLIDRILNPLNYINNFAKLSENLVGDIKANIEDEKENISPDNYDDTMEVLDMLKGNLEKVGVHGANTSRTLKAMEEMLKDRTGGHTMISLPLLLRQDEKLLLKYYEKEITEHNISIRFDIPDEELQINANPDQLSKTVMSLMRNAIYAVVKKDMRQSATAGADPSTKYRPEVVLALTTDGNKVQIKISDNGTGIDGTIIDRIFDPFFTTKTTGEASGVGLYLSREIAQNHGGDITVKSEKGLFTEFTITLSLTS